MGDPRKLKKKYLRPSKPWEKKRIGTEAELMKNYGYKNKHEIWRFNSILRAFRAQARRVTALTTEQADKERKQLLNRLYSLGLLGKDADIDDILELGIEDISERRLVTLVVREGFANTPRQARQFITHGHIMVDNKKISSPNYIVLREEDNKISFAGNSPFKNQAHPLFKKKSEKKKKGVE